MPLKYYQGTKKRIKNCLGMLNKIIANAPLPFYVQVWNDKPLDRY